MRFEELQQTMATNLFTFADVSKHFPDEKDRDLRTQLYRFRQKGQLDSPKRGFYAFDLSSIHEFELANQLYQPSYVSLESALNYYGMIPGITQQVTSVNPTKPKKFKTQAGVFSYHQIKQELFWGYEKIAANGDGHYFQIAEKEKALLDFFYLRKIKKIDDLRLDLKDINFDIYHQYVRYLPRWVQEIKLS